MVEKDEAVLMSVLKRLQDVGVPLKIDSVAGENLEGINACPDFVLTMAQSPESLKKLESWESTASIVNSVEGVRNCYRVLMVEKLKGAGVCFPASLTLSLDDLVSSEFSPMPYPFWIKRGDVHAMASGDVVFVRFQKEFRHALEHFEREQLKTLVIQEHIEGDVFKFYGVRGNGFFRIFLQNKQSVKDDSLVLKVRTNAIVAAEVLELEVFGGDVVLDGNGGLHLIDMNDWPSFSACTDEASEAIAEYIIDNWQLV
jgi:glutathione synthase/RimK-type ligase-like ATP-grasp enzyme